MNKEDDVVLTGYEAEGVTLTTYVSKETAVVRWLKDWTPVEGERFRALTEGHKRTLTVDPLRRSDAGEYACDVGADQVHFSLLVKGETFTSSVEKRRVEVWTEKGREQAFLIFCANRNENQVCEATPGRRGPR